MYGKAELCGDVIRKTMKLMLSCSRSTTNEPGLV